MISIIVSSYNPQIYQQFKKSIEQTIGVQYEIICIENPGLMGICEAYNIGGQKAKYPYLCFLHEDLIFHTDNWGNNIINHFLNNENLGLIGVAGSAYKPYVFSGWGSSWGDKMVKINLNQASKKEREPKHLRLNPPDNNISDRVVTLDGCFLCTKASVFASIKFDQKNFQHYHCYDIDYSLAVSETYTVEVVYDILSTHLSTGGYDKKWLDETIKLHKKWFDKLPYFVYTPSKKEIRLQEIGAYYWLLSKVLELQYGYAYLIKLNYSRKFIQLVGFKDWLWIQLKLPKNVFQALQKLRNTSNI